MPFREFAPFFSPDELVTLTAAFDETWRELLASDIDLSTEEQIARAKEKLARRILVSATAGGVRDVEKLKEQALRSLRGGVRPGGEQTYAPEPLRSRLIVPYHSQQGFETSAIVNTPDARPRDHGERGSRTVFIQLA